MADRLFWRALGVGAAFVSFSVGVAQASDVLSYPPVPPINDPIYQPASLVTGDVSIGLTYYAEPDDDYSVWDIFGSGRINVPLGSGPWYMTGELFGLAALNGTQYREYVAAGHLYHKTQQFAHGVYVAGAGYSEVGFSGGEFSTGLEGAAFLGDITLNGAVGFTWGDNDDGTYSGWDAVGVAKFYLTPNTSIAAAIATWGSATGWGLGARGEHLFDGSDLSVFATASWSQQDTDFSAWQASVGLRYFFHNPGATLKQRDWDSPFSVVVF